MSIERVKYQYRIIDQRAGLDQPPLLAVSIHHGVVPRGTLTEDLPRAEDLSNYKLCERGDIVLNRMRAFQGAIGISPQRGLVSPDYLVLRPAPTVDARYLHHLFRSTWFVGEMISRLRGIGNTENGAVRTPRINPEDFGDIAADFPPLDHQRRIADFLDAETARIDSLSDAQRQAKTGLLERRAAGVFWAVIGSDDNASRVPSKLAWADSLPAGWRSGKLSFYAQMGSGHTPSRSHPEWWEGCTIPWITTGEVSQVRDDRREILTETRERISEIGMANSSAELHPKGTVVLCRTASAGYSAVMGEDMATSQDFVTWTCGPELDPFYLLWCLRAMRSDLLGRLAMGSTHKTIYVPDLQMLRIPLPSLDDQHRIVAEIRAANAAVDVAVDAIDRQLALLTERRQALITAAVTGQIGVLRVRAHTEEKFEDYIVRVMLERGWKAGPRLYDRELGLDTSDLFAFIGATQTKSWDRLVELHGGEQTTAQQQFALRVANEIDARGVLDVLRHGVKDRGVLIELAYFRPGLTIAADALAEYNRNVLTVSRQLHFSARTPNDSVDLAFFVNGIPVATAELKNPNSGQDATHAIEQYRRRDPNDLFFAKRTLVHFAVDPDQAFIATRLAGGDTEFRPFNMGSAGSGRDGGAGNPKADPSGDHAVSYLWDEIWNWDNWLEILQRYVHVQESDKKGVKESPHTATRIFPRYHQWHAVQAMIRDAYDNGAGQNYLIQHSAGSGKSNTIAWLAHRLSALFDARNEPVFHKVVVITDRDVLDKQLQKTIYQFDHTPGVVKRIDEDSAQLATALADSTSKIIISTLQKYPFVLEKIASNGDLGAKRYAVIIDEAHSSQGGDAAARLKEAIGAKATPPLDGESAEEYYARVRGPQPNLSYFAFTATPKFSTLQLFGRPDARGMHVPFHVYSMRQAIEEGYILDVLANYITYDTKWRLSNTAVTQPESATANPDVDERKAKRELVRFAERHPTAVGQKARLIVEDFRDNIARRLGGRAKAMVVTTGRQEAFDLYQAIRQWDADLPDCGFGVLVAFSGPLKDKHSGLEFSETQLNGFSEGQLPALFGYAAADDPQAAARQQAEYRILVVAEKYQTGFDQPLLCGMYVDKPLTGVAAVQTLSRLNRTHPLKSQDDVRILDFVNTAPDIADAFEPWFRTTITEPTDPNMLYDKQREVMDYQLLVTSEMEAFLRVLGSALPGRLTPSAERDLHARLHSYLQPALDRFEALPSKEEREGFRKALGEFLRAYSLLAQLYVWSDDDLERLYQYGRLLAIRLPGRETVSVDIGDADLSHYRLEYSGRHNVSLSAPDAGSGPGSGEGVVRGYATGGGAAHDPEYRPLAEVIRELNERFGLDLGSGDEIMVLQQVVGIVEDQHLQQVGLMNDEARFGQVVDERLDDIVAENAERNSEFMKLYFDNPEFQKAIKEAARKRAYRIINQPARDEAIARLRAEMAREMGTDSGTMS